MYPSLQSYITGDPAIIFDTKGWFIVSYIYPFYHVFAKLIFKQLMIKIPIKSIECFWKSRDIIGGWLQFSQYSSLSLISLAL